MEGGGGEVLKKRFWGLPDNVISGDGQRRVALSGTPPVRSGPGAEVGMERWYNLSVRLEEGTVPRTFSSLGLPFTMTSWG